MLVVIRQNLFWGCDIVGREYVRGRGRVCTCWGHCRFWSGYIRTVSNDAIVIVIFGVSVFTAAVFLCPRICGLNKCYRYGLRDYIVGSIRGWLGLGLGS